MPSSRPERHHGRSEHGAHSDVLLVIVERGETMLTGDFHDVIVRDQGAWTFGNRRGAFASTH